MCKLNLSLFYFQIDFLFSSCIEKSQYNYTSLSIQVCYNTCSNKIEQKCKGNNEIQMKQYCNSIVLIVIELSLYLIAI